MSLKNFVKNDKNVAFFVKVSVSVGQAVSVSVGWLGLGLGTEILVSVDPW